MEQIHHSQTCNINGPEMLESIVRYIINNTKTENA